MPKPDKNYDEDFKRQAVGLYVNGTASLAQVARELGVSTNSLRKTRFGVFANKFATSNANKRS